MTERGHRWMRITLGIAAIYNLLWGAVVIIAPDWSLGLLGLDPPRYPSIWQCVGMVVGAYGIGYAIAATAPLRHWPIVLVGLIGKVAGPIGFVSAAVAGDLPWRLGWTILTNDLVWWLPFGGILVAAWRHHEAALTDGAVSIRRIDAGWRLTTTQRFDQDREEIFDFFADASNLERITPNFLNFSILTPSPIKMTEGARIDYRIRLFGIPIRWKTVIPCWQPPVRFIDQQIAGPYHRWIHEHRIEPVADGVEVHDQVDYRPRGGRIVHGLFVAPQLKRIFHFRRRALADIFDCPATPA